MIFLFVDASIHHNLNIKRFPKSICYGICFALVIGLVVPCVISLQCGTHAF